MSTASAKFQASLAAPDPLHFALHPKQGMALQSEATELLFGGAAGPGKSHYLRVEAIFWCMQIPGLQAFLFRRLYNDLKQNHMEGPQSFPVLLAPLIARRLVRIIQGEIQFWNGSKIYLRHLQNINAILKYMGAEIHLLLIDELTHFEELMYRQLRGRCRAVGLKFPAHINPRLFPRIRCGANPGNIGHHWVKRTFVDHGPYNLIDCKKLPLFDGQDEGGMVRQFIPALLQDNPSMAEYDPEYENKLKGLGDPLLVRMLLEGDWDVVAGSMFGDVWRREKHTCEPFLIPASWELWRGGDDGYGSPLAYYWLAQDPNDKTIYVIDELYGAGFLPDDAAERTLKKDKEVPMINHMGEEIEYGGKLRGLLDDSAFDTETAGQKPGTHNQQDLSRGDAMNKHGTRWQKVGKGKHSRIIRVQHLHKLLAPNPLNKHGLPGIRFFRHRTPNAIRTIPTLPRAKTNFEDVDTNSDDHCFDGVTYGLKWKRPGAKFLKVTGA